MNISSALNDQFPSSPSKELDLFGVPRTFYTKHLSSNEVGNSIEEYSQREKALKKMKNLEPEAIAKIFTSREVIDNTINKMNESFNLDTYLTTLLDLTSTHTSQDGIDRLIMSMENIKYEMEIPPHTRMLFQQTLTILRHIHINNGRLHIGKGIYLIHGSLSGVDRLLKKGILHPENVSITLGDNSNIQEGWLNRKLCVVKNTSCSLI